MEEASNAYFLAPPSNLPTPSTATGSTAQQSTTSVMNGGGGGAIGGGVGSGNGRPLPPLTSTPELPLDTLMPWLESHSIPCKFIGQLTPGSPLPSLEWCDGTLLCSLVESCEGKKTGMRVGIKGVDKAPRTAAARLANIRRALEALRGNIHMPLDLLWSELDIRAGVPNVIRGLLAQLYKVYHHHH